MIDEVRRVLFFFEHILVDAAGAVQEELERLLAEHYPGVRPPHGVLHASAPGPAATRTATPTARPT